MSQELEKRAYTALIFGNGAYPSRMFSAALKDEADLIIAADGAMNTLRQLGVRPDVLVGDMDSIDAELLEQLEQENVEILKFAKEKDQTDIEIAIDEAVSRGADTILLTGVSGNRIDHGLANLMLLERIRKAGARGEIREEQDRLFLVEGNPKKDTYLDLPVGTTLSVLPFSDTVEGVTLEGLQYPLRDARLSHDHAGLGISNQVVSSPVKIHADRGNLLVDIVREKC